MTNNLGFTQLPMPGLARGCRECRHWQTQTAEEAKGSNYDPGHWGVCHAGTFVNTQTEWDFSCRWFRRRSEQPTPTTTELDEYPRYGYNADGSRSEDYYDLDVGLCPRCSDQDIFPGMRVCSSCAAEINAE